MALTAPEDQSWCRSRLLLRDPVREREEPPSIMRLPAAAAYFLVAFAVAIRAPRTQIRLMPPLFV